MPAHTYKLPFDIDEEYGEHPVRKESFILDNEENCAVGSSQSRVRLLTDFVFVKEGKVVYPLYENCTDEFWQGVQVWGFMMSPGGSGRWFAWTLLWHLEWAGKHMELVRIDRVLGMSKERNAYYRNGNETALWITTREKNAYALMEPGDAAAPGWMAVIKSWEDVGLKGLTLPRVVDPSYGVPYWWNRDGQAVGTRAWQAIMKQWTALQEFEAATPPPPAKKTLDEGTAEAKGKGKGKASSRKSRARAAREESNEDRVEASSSAKRSSKVQLPERLPADSTAQRKPAAKLRTPRRPLSESVRESSTVGSTTKLPSTVCPTPSVAPGPSVPLKRPAAPLASSDESPETSTAAAPLMPPAKRRALTVEELTSPQPAPETASPVGDQRVGGALLPVREPAQTPVPPPPSSPTQGSAPPASSSALAVVPAPAPTSVSEATPAGDRPDSPFRDDFSVEDAAPMDIPHSSEWPGTSEFVPSNQEAARLSHAMREISITLDTTPAERPALAKEGSGTAGNNDGPEGTTSGTESIEIGGSLEHAGASAPDVAMVSDLAQPVSTTRVARPTSQPLAPSSPPAQTARTSSLTPAPPQGPASLPGPVRLALSPPVLPPPLNIEPPPAHVVLPVTPSAAAASASLETRSSRRHRLGRST